MIDNVEITVKAGNGGDGIVSFRREKYVPKGGPDGGNGGKGGDIYIRGVGNIRILKKLKESPIIKAQNGKPGQQRKKTGASAPPTYILVPFGSKIYNKSTNTTIEIINEKPILIAKGGAGGRGNFEFRSATNQTPRTAEKGKKGQSAALIIDLLLIADIGLIGLPNAGKSSLLNALTNANAKVANYHFTTLEPNLGALNRGKIIIADIPGLIEGASKGKGLGYSFLKHIERIPRLLHCISCESKDIVKDYKIIRAEIGQYKSQLLKKPEIIAITKADLITENQRKALKKTLNQNLPTRPLFISIYDEQSLDHLKKLCNNK